MAAKKKKAMTVREMASMGGRARAESLTPEERSEGSKKAADSKWASMTEAERKAHGAMLAKARAAKRKGKKR